MPRGEDKEPTTLTRRPPGRRRLPREAQLELSPIVEHVISDPFRGVTFCITGQLARHTRFDANLQIRARGGLVKDRFVKSIDVLVVSDAAQRSGSETTKLSKAREHGIRVMNESEFMRALHDYPPRAR